MGHVLNSYRVPIAAFLAFVLIGGTYIAARGIQSPSLVNASPETELLGALTSHDTDGDGLADWEEVLYGTDQNSKDSFNLGMSDSTAVEKGLIVPKAIADVPFASSTARANDGVDYATYGLTAPTPGTLNEAFTKSFFSRYLSAKQANGGTELSRGDVERIAIDTLSDLSMITIAPTEYKKAQDVLVSGSGPEALIVFAIQAEAIFEKNDNNASKSELLYLMDALEKNDQEALAHIASIAKSYRSAAIGLAALPVPKELATAHLAVINALVHTSGVIDAFAKAQTDPLSAMLALKEYVPAAQSLKKAFTDVANIYSAAGISLEDGEPGASYVNVVPL
jgi:hypothetical protein